MAEVGKQLTAQQFWHGLGSRLFRRIVKAFAGLFIDVV